MVDKSNKLYIILFTKGEYMLRLLKFLWTGDFHVCSWEEIEMIRVLYPNSDEVMNFQYICKCSRCGKIKTFRTPKG